MIVAFTSYIISSCIIVIWILREAPWRQRTGKPGIHDLSIEGAGVEQRNNKENDGNRSEKISILRSRGT
jgi:hypothetical protein